MTTDSEAWERFAAGALADDGADARIAAETADALLSLYRERQKRGDFGAPPNWPPKCDGTVTCPAHVECPNASGPSRLDAMEAQSDDLLRKHLGRSGEEVVRLQRSLAQMRAERDEARASLRATLDTEDRLRRERDEQRARAEGAYAERDEYRREKMEALVRAEAAEKALALTSEKYAVALKEAADEEARAETAESLLKEALGAQDSETLEAVADEICQDFKHTARARSLRVVVENQRAVLSKACAAGYEP